MIPLHFQMCSYCYFQSYINHTKYKISHWIVVSNTCFFLFLKNDCSDIKNWTAGYYKIASFESEKDNGFPCLGLFPDDCIAITFIWIPWCSGSLVLWCHCETNLRVSASVSEWAMSTAILSTARVHANFFCTPESCKCF